MIHSNVLARFRSATASLLACFLGVIPFGVMADVESSGFQNGNSEPEAAWSADPQSDLYQSLFPADEGKWQIGILLYAFLPVESDIATKLPGLPPLPEANINLDLQDAFDLLNMTFSGRVEAHRDEFGLFLEGYYVAMALDDSRFKFDFDQYFIDFGVSYALPPLRFSDGSRVALYTELNLGGRYVHFEQDVTLKTPTPRFRSASANYLEPFIGARLTLPFAEKWAFLTRGDVGGFGVGSDLTWTVIGGFAFHPAQRWEVALGYRVYSLEYKDGSGVNEFKFDAFQHGPYLGVGFLF